MKPNMNLEQQKRFWDFIFMDDFEFYDMYIAGLPEEAQERFFNETPDFFSDYINRSKKIDLKEDKIYQNIMLKIQNIKE
ncbi:hypothetical protein [Faecalicatena contorta]|jgi:hypothetical protein|uniref:Uncharacterized protein n=1 Tax=Faecalicatena contorta TaxID=39482 RepID=A0A315ZYK7_9FIRM|nr:hypothetical protein [Faecalicatena contorta]MBA4701125.1 hypothetical protein [Ruminococcus sp.]PWJ50741.1 hypothetical protein A8805_10334 [Faecalicatena contorta]SUQ13309.1 hypothetical protein SAMN05216529_10334 [Faecalicatena contorta]